MQTLNLTKEDCRCFVDDIYGIICQKLKMGDCSSKTVDVNKVFCSPAVKETIYSYYLSIFGPGSLNSAKKVFDKKWDEVGPIDVDDLDGYTVELEDGWCE